MNRACAKLFQPSDVYRLNRAASGMPLYLLMQLVPAWLRSSAYHSPISA